MKRLALLMCIGLTASVPLSAASARGSAEWLSVGACAPREQDARLDTQVRRTTALALRRLAAADVAPYDRYPQAAYAGDRTWRRSAAKEWTAGFYPGSLWLAYELTDDPAWAARADRWTTPMRAQATTTSHDVGFMLASSAGQQFRLTGDAAARTAVETAGRSLARHYVPAARVDTTWDSGSPDVVRVIVDSLMNLEVLLQAADVSGDKRLRSIAHQNARTILRTHVRPDGSTWHVADLDAADGRVLRRFTAQGLADGSTWARGQAWAVHGLTTTWRETGDPALLTGARRVADWWIDHVPSDCVPFWDFAAPASSSTPRDASAAAITASGLLELSRLEPDRARAAAYRGVALATLARLTGNDYTTAEVGGPSVLRRQVYRNGADMGAFAWGDHYLLEAFSRLRLLAPNASPLRSRSLRASTGNGRRAGDGRPRTAWVGGKGESLRLDLGVVRDVSALSVAWGAGARRSQGVAVATSSDGRTWSTVAHWRSSGRMVAPETLRFAARRARFVRLVAAARATSIAELRAYAS